MQRSAEPLRGSDEAQVASTKLRLDSIRAETVGCAKVLIMALVLGNGGSRKSAVLGLVIAIEDFQQLRVGDFADLRGVAAQKMSEVVAWFMTSEKFQGRTVAADFALCIKGVLDGRKKSRSVFWQKLCGQRSFDHFAAEIAVDAFGSDSPRRARERDVVRVATGLGQGLQ